MHPFFLHKCLQERLDYMVGLYLTTKLLSKVAISFSIANSNYKS